MTFHDFADPDNVYGFKQLDYEAIQHIPLLREAWVLSFRGAVETTNVNDSEQVPFFMLPALGGGSSLRGFSSWRFRDRNSLLLQGEWRIIVNRYIDMAVFFDAGKVTATQSRSEFRRLENRRRPRVPASWTARDTPSDRFREESMKACPSCSASSAVF